MLMVRSENVVEMVVMGRRMEGASWCFLTCEEFDSVGLYVLSMQPFNFLYTSLFKGGMKVL